MQPSQTFTHEHLSEIYQDLTVKSSYILVSILSNWKHLPNGMPKQKS